MRIQQEANVRRFLSAGGAQRLAKAPSAGDPGYKIPPLKILPIPGAPAGLNPPRAIQVPNTAASPYGGFDPDAMRRHMDTAKHLGGDVHSTVNHQSVSQPLNITVHGAKDPEKTSMLIKDRVQRSNEWLIASMQGAVG